MTWPKCGYILTDFDAECPRCAKARIEEQRVEAERLAREANILAWVRSQTGLDEEPARAALVARNWDAQAVVRAHKAETRRAARQQPSHARIDTDAARAGLPAQQGEVAPDGDARGPLPTRGQRALLSCLLPAAGKSPCSGLQPTPARLRTPLLCSHRTLSRCGDSACPTLLTSTGPRSTMAVGDWRMASLVPLPDYLRANQSRIVATACAGNPDGSG